KDSGVQNKKIHDEWDGFGNCRDLNDWIPLAHSFIPSDGSITYHLPALWGWSPLQNCNDPNLAATIEFPILVNKTNNKNKP
ncbi:MAG: hypothetical protein VX908_02885, partial [Planctomycetota bacterium]|nr:hypothetical protein [Planctomycetota bacterium]